MAKSRPVRLAARCAQFGIETVYQDLALIPALSMWRNFFLGREIKTRTGPVPHPRQGDDAQDHDGESARDGTDAPALAG